ncbi:MAG: TonB-dependent receptor [Acidobacteriaceae bacterium]|nr:TonB-dependent receptor [Acidobacteriaceae bacterium]
MTMDIRKKSRWSGRSSKWIAMGTLAAYVVGGGKAKAQAKEEAAGEGQKGGQQEQISVQRFQIAPGPLDQALEEYKRTTGVKLHTESLGTGLAGIHSHGVRGMYSSEAALREILAGTGLAVHFDDAEQATIAIRNTEQVDVSSGTTEAVSLYKFTQPLLDTPQTVNVIPQFVLDEQKITTLREALRNVPGISMAAGESGAQGDNLTIRGFTARNDIFLDGIRDFGSYYRDSFNFEQVEVLQGPAGVQFGRGSTGGIINQESKQPTVEQAVNVQVQIGSDMTRRVTADINTPMPDVAGGSAFRVNVVAHDAGVAGRPFAENRRFGFAPSVSFGMNSPTRYTVSYFHFSENDTPDYGLPWFFNKPAPADRHAYYGFPDQNYLKTNDDILTAQVEHTFNEYASLHSISRWANYPRQAQITEPQICSNAAASVPVGGVATPPTSAVNTGVACPYTPASDPANIVVNRNQIQIKSVEADLWSQLEGNVRFHALGIRQNLVAGVEGGQEVSNPIRTNYTINKINTVPSAMLVNPNTAQPFAGTGYILSVVHTKSKSYGLYFVDTLHLGRLFELSGGVRYDYFNTDYNLYQPVAPPTGGTVTAAILPISRLDTKSTYRAAFVYKPNAHGSVYFDYGTSFNPSAESLSLSATLADARLQPEQNETFEAGTKWNFLGEHLLIEGAWFHTEKDNAREPSPTDSTVTVNGGNQVVKGMQTSVVGRLPHGMNVIAGYAYLQSAVVQSAAYPTSVGYPLANVPKQTFNFFITHNLWEKLNLGVGGNYVGSRTASSTVPYVPLMYSGPVGGVYTVTSVGVKQVPGYWVFNAYVKRPMTKRIELNANIYNALNRFFIDQPHPSHLIPGPGLSVVGGLNFKF